MPSRGRPGGVPAFVPRQPRVCFLYIAQEHQTLHSVSAAIVLARLRPDLEVDLVATSQATILFLEEVIGALGGAPVRLRLAGPGWLRALHRPGALPLKLPMLLANAPMLASYDVIVAPERTTAALRWFGVRRPKLVYTQHGAGDRGGPFEPRLKAFDLVFAAGPKQRDRMAEAGLVPFSRCAVVGYPMGVLGMVAKSPPAVYERLAFRRDDQGSANELAALSLIRPSATCGHLGDVVGAAGLCTPRK